MEIIECPKYFLWRFELYPLVTKELKYFDLDRALHVEVKLNDLMDLFFLSKEQRPRKISSRITVLPWQSFCEMLWVGEIL